MGVPHRLNEPAAHLQTGRYSAVGTEQGMPCLLAASKEASHCMRLVTSVHSAQRMPGTLLAAMLMPTPVPQMMSPSVGVRADGSPGDPVRKYITSERGLAVLVRLHNWMPGYVVTWSNRFIKELQAEHPGLDLSDPDQWNQALEDAFVKKVCDERKRVKTGSYDDYALDLSRVRGSFTGPDAS